VAVVVVVAVAMGAAPAGAAVTPQDSNRYLSAFDARDGTLLWSAPPVRESTAAILVAAGAGVVVTQQYACRDSEGLPRHHVIAYDAKSGHVKWNLTPRGIALVMSTIPNQMVVLVDSLGLRGVNAATGKTRWRVRAGTARWNPATDALLVAGDPGSRVAGPVLISRRSPAGSALQALDPRTGMRLWLHRAPAGADLEVIGQAPDAVIIREGPSGPAPVMPASVSALKPSDGTARVTVHAAASLNAGAVLAGSTLMVWSVDPVTNDVTTTGYDTKTTRMRWTRTDLDSVVAVPGGHLALGRAPQLTLVGFDPVTGVDAWRATDVDGILWPTSRVVVTSGAARVDVRSGAVERFAQPLQLGTRPELDHTWAFDGTRIFAGTACPELD